LTPTTAPAVDLRIVKNASAALVDPGQVLTYTLAITNAGPSNAPSVTVVDVLPTSLGYVSATGPGWTCNAAGGTVTCDYGSLTVGPAPSITLVTTVELTATGLITNTASVSSPLPDLMPADNTDTVTTPVNVPTAVELTDFRIASIVNGVVNLVWSTGAEIDHSVFRLYRGPSSDFGDAVLITTIPGTVSNAGGADYTYPDQPGDGIWWYWLGDVDTQAHEAWYGPVTGMTHTYRLYLPFVRP
jgi:uncharacterized repeat protein (TIGR01451 family)